MVTKRKSPGLHGSGNRRAQTGYSLTELLITLTLTMVVVIGVGRFLDSTQTVYVAQMNLAEMQQSARGSMRDITRHLRMLGRGGFPASSNLSPMPDGLSITVDNNVPADTEILEGSSLVSVPKVMETTDILTVRGVFNSPIYQLNHADPTTFVQRVDDDRAGDLLLSSTTPTGVPQDLSKLIEIVELSKANTDDPPIREALLLASPLDPGIYAVAQLDPLNSDVSNPDLIRLRFVIADPSKDSSSHYANYYDVLNPGGTFPLELWDSRVGFVGVLEEYRFYVREEFAVPGDPLSDVAPRLSRARVYPASEIPYRNDEDYLSMDIADQVLDLQVALGFDSTNADPTPTTITNTDGSTTTVEPGDEDFLIAETADGANDDWLFNSPSDNPAEKPWNNLGINEDFPDLYFVRVTALVRTRQRDRTNLSRLIDAIEDRDYTNDSLNDREERLFRRTMLQTVIDLRNLG